MGIGLFALKYGRCIFADDPRLDKNQPCDMRLNHIAAFVLARWYLMVPPRYVIGIPMANWEHRAVFDTKAKCENAATLVQGILPPDDHLTITNPGPGYDPQLNSPQCVSSDDPVLAN